VSGPGVNSLKTETTEIIIVTASAAVCISVLLLNVYVLHMSVLLDAIALLSLFIPYLIYRNIVVHRVKKLELIFTNFLLDLSSIMETRVSLIQAMPSIYERDYGELTKYVRRLHIDTSWGMPFFDAFVKMGKKTKSALIEKSISVVMGTFVSGGDLKKIFNAIGKHTKEITNIKRTVRSRVKIISITCYFVFSTLLFSMYIIKKNFIPSFVSFGSFGASVVEEFDTLSLHLILIQSIFAGLITGQMAEDSIFAGVKHSLILVCISLIAYGLLL